MTRFTSAFVSLTCLLVLLVSWALAPGAAEAQDGQGIIQRPDRSILLGVGEETDLGFWMRIGERTDLGLDAGLRLSDRDSSNDWSLSLAPSLKRYVGEDLSGAVAPYLLFGLFASMAETETTSSLGGTTEISNEAYGALFGLGLDWYPTRRVSVGGHLGVDAALTRRDPATPGLEGDEDGFRIGTRSSGIRIQLYF